jgi:hypothetical protein
MLQLCKRLVTRMGEMDVLGEARVPSRLVVRQSAEVHHRSRLAELHGPERQMWLRQSMPDHMGPAYRESFCKTLLRAIPDGAQTSTVQALHAILAQAAAKMDVTNVIFLGPIARYTVSGRGDRSWPILELVRTLPCVVQSVVGDVSGYSRQTLIHCPIGMCRGRKGGQRPATRVQQQAYLPMSFKV